MGRIIILGKYGMLAHQVRQIVPHNICVGRDDYDLSKRDNIDKMLSDLAVTSDDTIVNAVGFLRQNISKNPTAEEKYKVFMLNSYLPSYLSDKCKLLHISTNCVFAPNKIGYRTEDEVPDGTDLYAQTKIWGEPNHEAMVLRTSIVGLELKNQKGLIGWFLQQKEATGFTNHLWNGVTTNTLANCIKLIIDNDLYKPGVFHILSTTISKYDILNEVNKYRRDPAILHKQDGPMVCHTLGTNNPEFLNRLHVPSFFDQIKEMMSDD